MMLDGNLCVEGKQILDLARDQKSSLCSYSNDQLDALRRSYR
jgi:hypothetical protein